MSNICGNPSIYERYPNKGCQGLIYTLTLRPALGLFLLDEQTPFFDDYGQIKWGPLVVVKLRLLNSFYANFCEL